MAKPTTRHQLNDYWKIEDNAYLSRYHCHPRSTLYVPIKSHAVPVPDKDFENFRRTEAITTEGKTTVIEGKLLERRLEPDVLLTGKTVFKIKTKLR